MKAVWNFFQNTHRLEPVETFENELHRINVNNKSGSF